MDVSIIVPLYNKASYVEETIQCVINQTAKNWELIVVDNGSSDNGPEIVKDWVAKDRRIELGHCQRRGPAAARNTGIEIASGDWVLFLDADDLLEVDYLEVMLAKVDEMPEANVVASNWKEFEASSQNREMVEKRPAGWNGSCVQDSAIAFTCWAVHAAIIKRSWLEGRHWPEELDGYLAEDTAFWFQIVLGAEIAYADYSGALYRTQTDNCRSDYSIEAWFEGTHQAVLANLELLKKQHRQITSGQCETLVRFYSGLYSKARKEQNRSISEEALRHAQHWMQQLKACSSSLSVGMQVRNCIGVANFESLRSILPSR